MEGASWGEQYFISTQWFTPLQTGRALGLQDQPNIFDLTWVQSQQKPFLDLELLPLNKGVSEATKYWTAAESTRQLLSAHNLIAISVKAD